MTAPSSNGRTPPFEGENLGSSPSGASSYRNRTKPQTCARKTLFTTKGCAEWFARRRGLSQFAYRCNQCSHWHLTSRAPAKAIEAQRAATTEIGVVHESAVPQGIRPYLGTVITPKQEGPSV